MRVGRAVGYPRRTATAVGAAALLALALTGTAPASAAPLAPAVTGPVTACPAPPQAPDAPLSNDINSDGTADTVIGAPGSADIRYGGLGGIEASQSALVDTPQDSGFGSAVDFADVNGDGCADVVVGSPELSDPGTVTVIYGPIGVGQLRSDTFSAPDAQNGDDFGAAVVVSAHDRQGSNAVDLWVGAPGHTVSGHKNAGMIYHYTFDGSGQPQLLQEFSEQRQFIPGSSATGDRFGAVLGRVGSDGVIVGVPDKTVGGKVQAGEVVRIVIDDTTGLLVQSQRISQGSTGVGGTVGAGNRFGASVADWGSVIGAPGTTVGSAKGAGAVDTFTLPENGLRLIAARYYTENTAGVPGVAERGDEFGAAVATSPSTCDDANDVTRQFAVGAPGESIGSATHTGSVTVLTDQPPNSHTRCADRLLYQGHGLPGTRARFAQVGQNLSNYNYAVEDAENGVLELMIGAPNTTVDGRISAGQVFVYRPSTVSTWTRSGGSMTNAFYGSVLPPAN